MAVRASGSCNRGVQLGQFTVTEGPSLTTIEGHRQDQGVNHLLLGFPAPREAGQLTGEGGGSAKSVLLGSSFKLLRDRKVTTQASGLSRDDHLSLQGLPVEISKPEESVRAGAEREAFARSWFGSKLEKVR